MRTRYAVCAALAALAVAVALYRQPSSSPTKAGQAEPARQQRDAAAASTSRIGATVAAWSAPLPEGVFAQVRPELERRARDGDAKAALRLARVLLNCHSFRPFTDAQMEDQIIDGLARAGEAPMVDGKPIPPDVLMEWMRGRMRAQRDLCAGTEAGDFTSNEADAKAAVALLERAAREGDTGAMIEYARAALAPYLLPTQVIGQAEAVREIRREAAAWLERALAAGDADALQAWSDEYQFGRLATRDAVQAYAYLYAYAQSNKAGDDDAWWRRMRLEQMRQAMTPAQVDEAQRKAASLLAQCCGGPVRAP